MAMEFDLAKNVRAERKLLITVAEWQGASRYVYTLVTSDPYDDDGTSTFSAHADEFYKLSDGDWTAGTKNTDTWAADTWYTRGSSTRYREILGVRTEDSSIELNADIQTSTDILGITYSDVNKTEPQQTFDPFFILGEHDLCKYLTEAVLKNDITKYSSAFDIYIITAFIKDTSSGTKYFAVKHKESSIIPTAIGGDAYVNLPVEVHFSNNITVGYVDKLTDDFTFTGDNA